MSDPLTIRDLVALGTILRAAQGVERVTRLVEDGNAAGLLIHGTARSIGTADGYLIRPNEDVRDAYLRVTTDAGLEVFWLVRDLMPAVEAGTFALM